MLLPILTTTYRFKIGKEEKMETSSIIKQIKKTLQNFDLEFGIYTDIDEQNNVIQYIKSVGGIYAEQSKKSIILKLNENTYQSFVEKYEDKVKIVTKYNQLLYKHIAMHNIAKIRAKDRVNIPSYYL